MLDRPLERAGVPGPRPLSVMSRVISPSWSTREMVTAVAWAWRAQLDRGFAGDGENVMSQRLVRAGVERVVAKRIAGSEAELRGVLVDDLHDPGGQLGGGRAGLVEPEDAGADLADDDLVHGIRVAVDPFRGRRVGAGGVALHPHAEGEQVLDDVVVQVARDPVVVFGLGQGDLVGAGPG